MTQVADEIDTTIRIRNTRCLDDLRNWISNHLDSDHSSVVLAARAGMSVSWLQRSFKKTYGYSVFTFIRYARLLRAQKQLEVTSMNIKAISTEAGYSSPASFTLAFRTVFGITPARFRKGCK